MKKPTAAAATPPATPRKPPHGGKTPHGGKKGK